MSDRWFYFWPVPCDYTSLLLTTHLVCPNYTFALQVVDRSGKVITVWNELIWFLCRGDQVTVKWKIEISGVQSLACLTYWSMSLPSCLFKRHSAKRHTQKLQMGGSDEYQTSPNLHLVYFCSFAFIWLHHHLHQSLNRQCRRGITDDFATSFLHFSLFSTALWDLPNSGPVHSLMDSLQHQRMELHPCP